MFNGLNKYRVWKPLGLLEVAGLTPHHWELTLIAENRGHVDYERQPKPDLVDVAAFMARSAGLRSRRKYRAVGVPVVIGGIHATFWQDEARDHADAVVKGEAESVRAQVLAMHATMRWVRRMRVASAAWSQFRLPATTCSRESTISARFKPGLSPPSKQAYSATDPSMIVFENCD